MDMVTIRIKKHEYGAIRRWLELSEAFLRLESSDYQDAGDLKMARKCEAEAHGLHEAREILKRGVV